MQTNTLQNLRLIIPATDISLNQPKHPIFKASGERAEAGTPSFFHGNTLANLGLSLSFPPTAMTSPDQVSCGGVKGHATRYCPSDPCGAPKQAWVKPSAEWVSGYQAPPAGIHFVKRFSSSSGLKSRNPENSLNFFSNSGVCWRSLLFGRIATYWAELMRRTLAPLRKIVARELEVFELRRNSVHPQSFAVHDRLECGHTHTSLLWDIFDLLNGYTESPHVRAIRHRCQECLTLTQRKPMQSVAAVAKAA